MMIQMFELSDKLFKVAIITMLYKVKLNTLEINGKIKAEKILCNE